MRDTNDRFHLRGAFNGKFRLSETKKGPTWLYGGASNFGQLRLCGELQLFLPAHHQSRKYKEHAGAQQKNGTRFGNAGHRLHGETYVINIQLPAVGGKTQEEIAARHA